MACGGGSGSEILDLEVALSEVLISWEESRCCSSTQHEQVELSEALVVSVMEDIFADPIAKLTGLNEILALTSSEDLTNRLLWLNECLSVKEVATWSKFHRKLSVWCDVGDFLGNRQNRSLVAMDVMIALVKANKPALDIPASDMPLTERHEAILAYVAGYLLQKMRVRHPDIVPTFSLSQSPTEVAYNWLDNVNRGGLVIPCVEFLKFVKWMEVMFRQQSILTIKRPNFVSAIVNGESLETPNDIEQKDFDNFIFDCASLFFTVRMHKKCRMIIDDCEKTASYQKLKKKPLRDSI